MSKIRTTISLEENVLRAVRVRAAREGCSDSEVFERALRREVGLDVLEELWASAELDEEAAATLAQEAVAETRRTHGQR